MIVKQGFLMILASIHSELEPPSIDRMPEFFKVLLNKIRQQHYAELYESEADGTTSLSDALREVLSAFRTSNQTLCHLRYVWMALILAVVVEPTMEYYQPSNLLPKDSIKVMELWLEKTIQKNIHPENNTTSFSIDMPLNYTSENPYVNQANQKIGSLQAINEALDVFYNAIRVLNYELAIEAILEILDDCLEGYAIFPGSYGRRELFDWWLLEVVPASWFLLPPTSLYLVEGRQNKSEIQWRQQTKLEQVSFKIRQNF
jgi:hypothetical protein